MYELIKWPNFKERKKEKEKFLTLTNFHFDSFVFLSRIFFLFITYMYLYGTLQNMGEIKMIIILIKVCITYPKWEITAY